MAEHRAAPSPAGAGSSSHDSRPLLNLLKAEWAKGALPPWKVQSYASAAGAGGVQSLEDLSRVGAEGKYKNNAQRDLMRAWGRPSGAPDMYWHPIPIKGKDGEAQVVQHPFVLPHQLFASLYRERPELFASAIKGSDAARDSLWKHLAPWVKGHPDLGSRSTSQCIPLGLHGDGGSYNKNDQLYVFTWNSLTGEGVSRDTRNVATILKKSCMLPNGSTLQAVFHVLAWSLNALLEGKTPSVDPDGAPIAGGGQLLADGWSGATMQVRGDWAFFCQAFGFPSWRSDEQMCWLCKASNVHPSLFWTNFNSSAGWRKTIWTHEAYLSFLESSGAEPSGLFGIRGLRVEMIMGDVLHAVDLGVAAHVAGNILFELLPKFGRNQEEQVKQLQLAMQEYYKNSKVASRMDGRLTLDRLRTKGQWPKLKAKAAAVRNLIPFVAALARQHNSGSDHDRRRLEIANDLNLFYDILRSEGQILSRHGAETLRRIGESLPRAYAHLAAEAVGMNKKGWKLVPKFHLFQHILLSQARRFGNPKTYWTYADEDMVGQMVEVGQSCHSSTMPATALFKWLVLQFHR